MIYKQTIETKIIRRIHEITFVPSKECGTLIKELKRDIEKIPDNARFYEWHEEEDTEGLTFQFIEEVEDK